MPHVRYRRGWSVPRLAIALLLFLAPAVMAQTSAPAGSNPTQSVQDSPSPSGSDLSAAAQRAREERARQRAQRSASSEAVNRMAADLSESSDQPLAGAPAGYRYYIFKPGNYAILVPADAQPQERDSFGLRLLSAEALSSRIEVILGDPIPAAGNTPEEMLHNASSQYFSDCNLSIVGLGPPVGGHPSRSVSGFSMCPLHNEILGSAEFVLADGQVMPVVCGYPFKAEDLDPSPNQPIHKILSKYDRERDSFRVCNVILPSLRFDLSGAH